MKLITAIIRPEKLEAVQAVLQPQEACLVSASQVLSFGAESASQRVYRGATHQVRPTKLRLEITVEDRCVDDVVDAIAKAGATSGAGRLGDGAIFVTYLDECVRIGRDVRTPLSASA